MKQPDKIFHIKVFRTHDYCLTTNESTRNRNAFARRLIAESNSSVVSICFWKGNASTF